jgi:hypothetical protein
VSPKARKRAAAVAFLALVAGGILAFGQTSGSFAIFNGDTESPNAAAQGSWVVGPSAFSAPVASGNGEYFTWTVGNHGVNAQEVYFADQGATANCTGASYSNTLYAGGTALGNAVATIDGANAGTSSDVPAANEGDYICYQIRSTYNTWYTSTNVGTAVQVGLVPTSFASNAPGTIDKHTNFTINFNHPISYTGAGTITITTNASTLTLPGIATVPGTFTSSISCSTVVTPGTSSLVLAVNCGGSTSTTASGSGRYTATASNVTSTIGPAGHAYSVSQCNSALACKPQMTW